MSFMLFLIFCRAVLDTSIGVMHQRCSRAPLHQGHFKCSYNLMRMHTLMHTLFFCLSRPKNRHTRVTVSPGACACNEAGSAQPTLDALIRLAKVLHVSLDGLVFDDHERGPSDDLALQFEAVRGMSKAERRIIKALLDGMILKYQAKKVTERGCKSEPAIPPALRRRKVGYVSRRHADRNDMTRYYNLFARIFLVA